MTVHEAEGHVRAGYLGEVTINSDAADSERKRPLLKEAARISFGLHTFFSCKSTWRPTAASIARVDRSWRA